MNDCGSSELVETKGSIQSFCGRFILAGTPQKGHTTFLQTGLAPVPYFIILMAISEDNGPGMRGLAIGQKCLVCEKYGCIKKEYYFVKVLPPLIPFRLPLFKPSSCASSSRAHVCQQ